MRTLALVGALVLLVGCGPTAGTDTDRGAAQAARTGSPALTVAPGLRPTVSWEPLRGAEFYGLTVLPDAGPGWAWEGTETSVVLGGATGDGTGFRLSSAAVVTVTAHDRRGTVIRLDQIRVAAPA
ncbi:MAG: hypothetical protein ACK5LS_02675 [Propioniciclava sp.]